MMLLPAVLCSAGIGAGWLLLRKVPLPAAHRTTHALPPVSIIIPARNEETVLPRLLASIAACAVKPHEVIVVDDQSTDHTAQVAAECGARALQAPPPEAGWRGKNWACYHGALAARAEVFFFLDADTAFVKEGYARVVEHFCALPGHAALSVLPFHRMPTWGEQLSLFFNLMTAMAAGGFTGVSRPLLFGQSLLISRELYFAAGGHAAVRSEILENLQFASRIAAVGGQCYTIGGRTALEMRMFPHGGRQRDESWRKGFANGARSVTPQLLLLSFMWLGGFIQITLLVPRFHFSWIYDLLYLAFVLQLAAMARQLGDFRWLTVLCFPIPLTYYLVIFTQSVWRRVRGRTLMWKGREL